MTWDTARRGAAAILAGLLALGWWLAPPLGSAAMLARFYLKTQDGWLALALIAALLLLRAGGSLPPLRPGRLAGWIAAAMLVGCWLGARVVMLRHDFSRDEQMATFDARIFAGGHLFQPFPPAWREFWYALNQTFVLPIGDHEGWVSAYLPVNAALRALFGIIDPTLAGPVYAAVGALALWRIAVRLWPDAREAQVTALLLYVGASQVWITAMTAYAMSAHLALNLVWLWLFLGEASWGRARWRHGAAIAVGLFATGLHQPVFHPLFVAPFLILLLRERRYPLLGVYVAGYALIALVWASWPGWLSAQGQHAVVLTPHREGIGFLDRLAQSGHPFGVDSIGLMAANLVRFATWQHPLLLPLAAIGIAASWREGGIGRALALGLLLPALLVLEILPDQGFGWGFRYLHGVIGNACLLGGYSWRALGAKVPGPAPGRAMLAASAASVALILPLHAVMAHRMVAPSAAARAAMLASGADIVLVDDQGSFLQDLVTNRADLSNRPILLKASAVRPEQIPELCARGSIAFAAHPPLARVAAELGLIADDTTAQLRRVAERAGCRVR